MTAPKPATPLPWTYREDTYQPNWWQIWTYDGGMGTVAEAIGSETNAAYIVAACNAYPGLLAERAKLIGALRKCASRYPDDTAGDFADARVLLRKIREDK